ncbi:MULTISPECIES: hypothetical protein [Streptomyces]|uniref:Transmembrane protein n=2 Tax=Streptomyces TaxID=1883 RepID=A0A100Y6U2_9ACTN|nr:MULTISPECIES: hypothetical protein [Streptomyces]KUH38717.1 hypothetical protein ATE80_11310 [Streptomyces kanasensis]UUS32020.1 hypothetical protein NRO40_15140 [Streptomyces changanensis]
MTSAPHLLPEDRADYERVLDEALRTATDRPEPSAAAARLGAGQLRAMALDAAALINTAAATEYAHLVRVREEHRRPSGPVTGPSAGPGFPGPQGEVTPGAGLGVVVTVLTPVLAGTAAVVLLLLGYVLRMLDPPPDIAGQLLSAGWFFAAVTAAGLLAAGAGLLVTALRNRPAEVHGTGAAEPDEVARAREAWHHALRERGVLPFLYEALAASDAHPVGTQEPTTPRPPAPGLAAPHAD